MKSAAENLETTRERTRTIVRWIVGAIFLAAGVIKIARPGDFYSDLLAYEVALPDFLLRLVAVARPWLEVICGVALLVDRWIEAAGCLIALMCLVFVLMLGQAVIRGLDLQCGCFGAGTTSWFDRPSVALARAVMLLAMSVWLLCKSVSGAAADSTRSLARES